MRAVGVGHAHVDVVLVAGDWVGELRRRDLRRSGEAGENALRHLLLGKAQPARLLAVDLDVQLGIVLLARDLHVGQEGSAVLVGERAHCRMDLAGEGRALRQVVAEQLHVDGRGRSEV